MKNFTTILIIFFTIFIIISLYLPDRLWQFITLFLGYLIALVCLGYYIGPLRGIILAIGLSTIPFIIEFFGYSYKVPYFTSRIFTELSAKTVNLPISVTSISWLFSIPLIFISCLFFSQKIKVYFGIKKYHQTSLIITASILIAINFLDSNADDWLYHDALKWLIIPIFTYFVLKSLIRFKAETPDLYKEIPIVIFLTLYGVNSLNLASPLHLTITGLLLALYLVMLYSEHKIRKISEQTLT